MQPLTVLLERQIASTKQFLQNKTVIDPHVFKNLERAAMLGHIGFIMAFLSRGGNPNATDASGRTLMHYAAYANQVEVLKELINEQGDVNVQDKQGWTPLHLATMRMHTTAMKTLLQANADYTLVDKKTGWTPMHVAALTLNTQCVNLLLEAGASPTPQSLRGITPSALIEDLQDLSFSQGLRIALSSAPR